MDSVFAIVALSLLGCGQSAKLPLSNLVSPPGGKTIQVSSPDFKANGPIPDRFTSYFENVPLTIRWSSGPSKTKSYVLLVEDPDAPKPKPVVHWLITDIPLTARQEPGEGQVGKNENGTESYYGPHPPDGPAHRYFVQIFALDLPNIRGRDRDSVAKEIAGHILAKGVLIGLYQKK